MSPSTSTSPAWIAPAAEASLVSLLVALAADYPDLDRHTVAQAVEHAASTAEVLSPGLAHTRRQVETLARDRLDAAARRTATGPGNTSAEGRRG